MKAVRLLELARAEYFDAQSFYESRVPGLGDEFLAELEQALKLLASRPGLGKVIGARLRSWPLRRFPFSIIYTEYAEGLLIVAVAHQRRKPGYWRGRIAR